MFYRTVSIKSITAHYLGPVGVNWLTLHNERRGQCFGPVIVLLYTSVLFSILEKELIGNADDSTLIAVVPW